MITLTVGNGAEWGHVSAVFSRRLRGHAAPADLLRAHLRGVTTRRRLAVAFSDYLVSEPVESLALWRGPDGRPVLLVPTDRRCFGLRGRDRFSSVLADEVGALDAPEWLPAGSVRRHEMAGEYCSCAEFLARGGRA